MSETSTINVTAGQANESDAPEANEGKSVFDAMLAELRSDGLSVDAADDGAMLTLYKRHTRSKIVTAIKNKFLSEAEQSRLISEYIWTMLTRVAVITNIRASNKSAHFDAKAFDANIKDLEEEVVDQLAVSQKEVNLVASLKAWLLEGCVRNEIGDLAAHLSFYEYRMLAAQANGKGKVAPGRKLRALKLDKANVEAHLNDGWLHFIQSVAEERATGGVVTRTAFEERLSSYEDEREKAWAEGDPALAQYANAMAKEKDRQKKIAKTIGAVSTSMSEALASGFMTPTTIADMLRDRCTAAKVALPGVFGIRPEDASNDDLHAFVVAMLKAKRLEQVRFLRDMLVQVVDRLEANRAAKAGGAAETIPMPAKKTG